MNKKKRFIDQIMIYSTMRKINLNVHLDKVERGMYVCMFCIKKNYREPANYSTT